MEAHIVPEDVTEEQYSVRKLVTWVLFTAVALAAIFRLPYLIASKPVISASYMFGYNNRVGVLLLLMFTAGGAIYTNGLGLKFLPMGTSGKVSPKILLICLGITLFLCIGIYVLTAPLGGFGESTYLLDRVKMVGEGRSPYKGFEFPYGMLLLYGPVFLQRTLHVTLSNAYYIFWLSLELFGVAFLFYVVNRLDYPSKHKKAIFILFYSSLLGGILTTGLQYTFVRFVIALYFAVIVHKVFDTGNTRKKLCQAYSLVAIFTCILLLVSPEIGLAYAIGSMAFFAAYGHLMKIEGLFTFLGMVSVLAAAIYVGNTVGIFTTLKQFGGGGNNFPIIPAPHIMIFFGCFFLCACYVLVRVRQASPGTNTIYVIAVSIPMIPAALGRCDPVHVASNGAGIMVVASFLISGMRHIWKFYKVAFIIFFVIWPCAGSIWLNQRLFVRAAVQCVYRTEEPQSSTKADILINRLADHVYGDVNAKAKLENLKRWNRLSHIDLYASYPHSYGIINVPFAYIPGGFTSYRSPKLDSGYYWSLDNLFSPRQVDEKIEELKRHPNRDLLLPGNVSGACKSDPAADRKLISMLFLYPFNRKVVHAGSVMEPLCRYIADNYQILDPPTDKAFGYGLWVPRS